MLVLLVTPKRFMNGSRIFMRELSAVLETIAFIKETDDGRQMIYPFALPLGAPMSRSRREEQNVRAVLNHHLVRRAQKSNTGWVSLLCLPVFV